MDSAPTAAAAIQLPTDSGPPPDSFTNPITDIRTLLPQLKEVLSSATHADDEGILEIWVQLCRAIAFLGPFYPHPTGANRLLPAKRHCFCGRLC
ncbi:hypothetical protein CPLU01_15428 [Colletotrichum plurivorum]|uniref:Uncharacterized protein n=1 Tax=Colletotrichum plurivorum TaxID=2175906 RepID=A0A8H6JBH2_9PEZI|nr:hypothetical protein CPLU01_15428 [Colletotrichum plurivorum]